MAKPQLENGYTRIANELLEALYTANFNSTQFKIVLFILRYTYGFNRKEHNFSLNFLANGIGVSRRYISSEVKALITRNVISIVKEHTDTQARVLKFNKNYEEWDTSGRIVQQVKDCSTGEVKQDTTDEELFNTTDEELFNTTDEELFTQIKKNIKKNIYTGGESSAGRKRTTSPKNNLDTSPVKTAIDYYHKNFVDKFHEKPIIAGKKDGELMKKLVNTYGLEKVKDLLDKFFNAEDEFIKQSGYTIGVFFTQINKLLTIKKNTIHGRL